MYENQTYELILNRLLERVPGGVDKREGSILYDALAPAAAELTQAYQEMDALLNETFADTAGRESLIRRAAERGVRPEPAACAVWKGEFNRDVPLGSRFSLEDLNFIAESKIADGQWRLRCETPGRAGNGRSGTLIPIDYIDGLTKAELTELLIPGEDEESTESLRRRYFDSLDSQAFGGNIQDYKEKVNAIPGVGGVKVYPAWNGGGTVKLVILNSEYRSPSAELVEQVQSQVDPGPNQGQGLGFAPIGHLVTVRGAVETAVDISTEIVYEDGWTWKDIETYAQAAVDGYFTELSQLWDKNEALVARISQIETRLLDVAGVLDISATTINGAAQNLVLASDAIPKRGVMIG